MPIPLGMGGFLSRKLALDRLELLDIPLLWDPKDNEVTLQRDELFAALSRAAQQEATPGELTMDIMRQARIKSESASTASG